MSYVYTAVICLLAGAAAGYLYGGRISSAVKADIAEIKGKLNL